MPAEMRDYLYGNSAEEGFEVWPENWRALNLFCFCATQWQFSESGARLGLNYTGVQSVLAMHRIPPRQHARLVGDIRLIEWGALKALQEKAET